MVAFIDRYEALTICKFRFEALFIPIKIRCLLFDQQCSIEKLMRMHNKETYMCVYTHLCACIDIRVYSKYMRIIQVCVVRTYLSCTVREAQ